MTSLRSIERRLEELDGVDVEPSYDEEDLSLSLDEKKMLSEHFDVEPPT